MPPDVTTVSSSLIAPSSRSRPRAGQLVWSPHWSPFACAVPFIPATKVLVLPGMAPIALLANELILPAGLRGAPEAPPSARSRHCHDDARHRGLPTHDGDRTGPGPDARPLPALQDRRCRGRVSWCEVPLELNAVGLAHHRVSAAGAASDFMAYNFPYRRWRPISRPACKRLPLST